MNQTSTEATASEAAAEGGAPAVVGAVSPAALEAVAGVARLARRVRDNISRVIVGKEDIVELVLVALLSEGHILLEDVPGLGKTVLAKSIARSIGCTFKRIQFTPDLIPSDVSGINFYNQRSSEFEFRAGPIFAQIVLADEINRATPRTQSALLEAMEERQLTMEGVTMALPSPFLVIATQNPIELEGTFPLPEAQLDRFLLRLKLGYPNESEERAILDRFEHVNPLHELSVVADAAELAEGAQAVTQVYCEPVVRDYVVHVVQATRRHAGLELGASPRASLALFRAARSRAAVQGRAFVLPDDVKSLAPYVLPHRLILSSSARLRGRDTVAIVQEVIESVPVPVVE